MDDDTILDVLRGKVAFDGDFFSVLMPRLKNADEIPQDIVSCLENNTYTTALLNKKQRKLVRDHMKELGKKQENFDFKAFEEELKRFISDLEKNRADTNLFIECRNFLSDILKCKLFIVGSASYGLHLDKCSGMHERIEIFPRYLISFYHYLSRS